MSKDSGIIIDFPKPEAWNEENVYAALGSRDESDVEDGPAFDDEELRFLTKVIMHYMVMNPIRWGDKFEIEDLEDLIGPEAHGLCCVNMVYPGHLEPPVGLRVPQE